jgi:hypothetical protein
MCNLIRNPLGTKHLTLVIFVPNDHEDVHTHLLMSLFHELLSN